MSIEAKRTKRLLAGVLAGALALSVTPILGLTGTAGAAHEPATGEGSVCEDAPDSEPFTDVTDADPAQAEIECLFNTGITVGTSATTYSPNANVQRRQMALFLVRLADVLEENETSEAAITELPDADGVTPFTDIAAENQETKVAIDRLNEAGIALGTTATTFSPGDNVTREQMAAFIVRLQEFAAGEDATPDNAPDAFTDDEDSFAEEELNILAAEGVYLGVGNGEVNPGDPITRRQMARVLIRKLQYMFEEGDINRLFDETTGQASVTSRPELQSARIVQTNATQGTTVQYCFDEAITGAALGAANLFHVYTAAGAQDPGGAANAAFVDSTNTSCANVTFPGITAASTAAGLTVATVDIGAVTGTLGTAADQNPEGDAPLGTTGTSTFTAGITAGPDLQSASGFRADPTAPSTFTLVDFTFDEAAYRVAGAAGTDGYFLVQQAGNAVAETECQYVSGAGTTVHTVRCANPTTGAFSATNVNRAYVEPATVTDDPTGAAGNTNVLHAADVAAGGNTDTPDLVSCTFQPDVKGLDATTNIDRIIYTFDEPVIVTGANTTFNAYLANSTEVDGQAAGGVFQGPTRSTANDTQVAVDFADGTLATAVGCSVETGAVAEATNATATNRPDEVGVANSGVAQTAGVTAGPDLTAVVLTASKDAFGTITGYVATYAFDEDIETTAGTLPGDFKLWNADGTQLTCTGGLVFGSTEETDNTVTCTQFAGSTLTQLANAVLGTVDGDAVEEQGAGTLVNPEGAAVTAKANF